MAWLKCEFLREHVGETFDGVIAAVVPFGFFVELEGIYIEGLVHISTLGGDYYHHDSAKHRLVGERTATSFRLGDEVRVQVVRVDLDDRKIDLELVSEPSRRSGGRKASGKGGASSAKGKAAEHQAGDSKAGKGGKGRSRSRKPSAKDQLAAEASREASRKSSGKRGDDSKSASGKGPGRRGGGRKKTGASR
jgi:ribonuclease R